MLHDTDGDGVWDQLEIEVGTDPTDPNSVDLAAVVEDLRLAPVAFTLVVNTVLVEDTTRQLRALGRMIDGNDIDVTRHASTTYASSDLLVSNFSGEPGRVYAAQDGNAVITATFLSFSAQANVTVLTFAPTALGAVALPGCANGVAVSGSYAYVATGSAGLVVVDVSEPAHPAIAGAVNTEGNAEDVAVSGNWAFVADGANGLRVIDVTDAANPVLRGLLDTPGQASDVAIEGSNAYVADGSSGLRIVDISTPEAPVSVGMLETAGEAVGVAVSGDTAVIADTEEGVHFIDVANPASPALLSSTHTRSDNSSRAAALVVNGQRAYVADAAGRSSLGDLRVIDWSEPTTPVVVGASSPSFGPADVECSRLPHRT